MDLYTLLLIILLMWVFACINIALLWFIHQQNKHMEAERLRLQEERKQLGQEIAKILQDSATERKDLYDRLQAGTLQEYKQNVDGTDFEEEETDDDIVDLDEAKNELMGVPEA